MKKEFKKAEVEVIEFDKEDVIATSTWDGSVNGGGASVIDDPDGDDN